MKNKNGNTDTQLRQLVLGTFLQYILPGAFFLILLILDWSSILNLTSLVKNNLKFIEKIISTFVSFKKMIENHLSLSIKSIQSDGGGEFVNKIFSMFLTDHGIVHRLSCPYTAEQNGLVERKHRCRMWKKEEEIEKRGVLSNFGRFDHCWRCLPPFFLVHGF